MLQTHSDTFTVPGRSQFLLAAPQDSAMHRLQGHQPGDWRSQYVLHGQCFQRCGSDMRDPLCGSLDGTELCLTARTIRVGRTQRSDSEYPEMTRKSTHQLDFSLSLLLDL